MEKMGGILFVKAGGILEGYYHPSMAEIQNQIVNKTIRC